MQEKNAGLSRREFGHSFYLTPIYDLKYGRAQWEHYRKLLLRCCPTLLELDKVAGKELIAQLVAWVQQCGPRHDWTFPISLCRWLLQSPYAETVTENQMRAMLGWAATHWAATDASRLQGIVLVCSSSSFMLLQWKGGAPESSVGIPLQIPENQDFAWSPIMQSGLIGLRRWLDIPV